MSDSKQSNGAEHFEFKAEVRKLLSIITHSLYTNREIFLRELISNASDALDKLRFETSRGTEVVSPDLELKISIAIDKDAKKIVISDTGLGMSHDELVENIGTIARSGSEAFLEKLASEVKDGAPKEADSIIGRFGVGFYSVFMVADKVVITSRSYRAEEPVYVWESDGAGAFDIRPAGEGEADRERGTSIEVFFKEDAAGFLEKSTLEDIIKRHSSFIAFPIEVEGERVNTIPALWREPKFQVTKEQYTDFYKFLTLDNQEPIDTLHVAVDAPVQFTALLFIPKRGFDLFGTQKDRYGLDLYVRRVLIQRENKDLIPEYLGFLKGVVDTEDLPLNISRETLQENILIRKINATLVKQALSHLEKMALDNSETYNEFWKVHGKTFKMGYGDFANREKVASLLRFNSSYHDDASGLTSFDEYASRMKEGQKEIYYISGASREAVNLNPHLEIFRSKGIEVLYLYEPIDEFAMDALREFKEYTLTSAEHVDMAKLDTFEAVEKKESAEPELSLADASAFDKLLVRIKDILGDKVTEVRASERLSDSPSCLISPDGGITSSMQKIMHIVGKDSSVPQKIFELNRDHHLVRTLLRIFKADPEDAHVTAAVEQLFESALLLDGYLSDPHAMVERINSLLEKSSDWYAEIKDIK